MRGAALHLLGHVAGLGAPSRCQRTGRGVGAKLRLVRPWLLFCCKKLPRWGSPNPLHRYLS